MKNIMLLVVLLFLVSSCQENSSDPSLTGITPVEFTEVLMAGMDKVSMGGELQTVVRTQLEYNALIYERFQKPLDDYWNTYYESTLNSVKQYHPGLTDSEYVAMVKQIFYSCLPFMGTDTCKHPIIDFSKYTLLGQSASAGGCKIPDYQIKAFRDYINRELIYKVKIVEHGTCLMAINKNKWILVPKIPTGYKVVFEKEITTE
jgi:hypothetical protein